MISIIIFTTLIFSCEITSSVLKNVLFQKKASDTNNSLQLIFLRRFIEETHMTVDKIIEKHGYSSQIHHVITEDFYILTIHRIISNKEQYKINRKKIKKPVVFLQHGLLASSADWILTGPQKALGYILFDAGYDVWMGNMRGNRYSRNHTFLDPYNDAAKFWDFSWHEMGLFDLPTMIDYVLEETQQKKLYYVGHSQGTTVFYVMISSKPEYNEKVIAHISMAPVAYLKHVFSPILRLFSTTTPALEWLTEIIGLYEFFPSSNLTANLAELWCSDDSLSQIVCRNALFAITGFNKNQLNNTILPLILAHTPAGSSTKQLIHYGQLINSGKFEMYDYGNEENTIKYNSSSPPSYKLNKCTIPIYLFYSKNDWINSEEDVHLLDNEIGTAVRGKFLNPHPKWNHMDYIYGIDANVLVYQRILNLLKHH